MMRRIGHLLACGMIAAVALPSGVMAQAMPTSVGHASTMMLPALVPEGRPTLTVKSPAFASNSDIPLANTQYGANRFPGLTWTHGPAGTRSYAVVIQGALGTDPAAGTSVHLFLYDLPAGVTTLPAGMTLPPSGARLGPNVHGASAPYAGPHTHGTARQAYHVQVFALDSMLQGGSASTLTDLTTAMRGHVLAGGELVGYASGPIAVRGPVRVDSGQIAGIAGRDPALTVYKGIPYAAPPVGTLRWRAPAAPAAWTGVRAADRFGAACPQPGAEITRGMAQSEDCLTLNIWTGAKSGAIEKRPVYVWIYGGGFIGGAGANPEFDGEALARKGVVVVTFNYRVGVLGFLSTPELSRESGHGASGNYGLLDDIAVLQWVQRNIAAFGGDPSKVTIGGQSAGAGAVGFLAMSPLARGLFRAGILESHARYPRDTELRYLSVSYRTLADAERAGERYGADRGGHSLAELRTLPWQTLVEGSRDVDGAVETGSDGKPPLFRPVVDGWVIPHTYADTYARRSQNAVTIIAGNNKDETGAVPETAFAALRAQTGAPRAGMPQTNVTLAAFRASAKRKFGTLSDAFLRLYPARTDAEAALQNNMAARDNSRISTWLWGTLWTPGSDKPVYTYWWTHAPPGPDHDARGAYHGSEIPYAFASLDTTARPWTASDRQLAETMSSYWANIVKTGNPNGPGLPQWPRYDPALPQVMALGDTVGPIPVASPDRIVFWKRFYATQPAW